METPQDNRQSFDKPLSPGAEEDREQQHGGNAVVSEAGEEGDQRGLVLSGLAQGGLDQGEPAEGEVPGGEHAPEGLAQFNPTQEATGAGEAGEQREEEMEGRQDGDGASSSEDDMIQQGGGQYRGDHPQPRQEAAIPEVIRNQRAVNRLINYRYRRTRFTHSQLHDLERLFQESHYPSLRARRDLARWMGVDEADVQNWFRMRRSLYQRNRRLLMFCELPPLPESDSP